MKLKDLMNYECATLAARGTTAKELMALLLVAGYGVASLKGSPPDSAEQQPLLVVNVKYAPKFQENLSKLSEYYEQDSFLYIPEGSETTGIDQAMVDHLQLDTFDKYSANGKQAIHYYACQIKHDKEKQRRKAVVEEIIKKMNGDRVPSLFFRNRSVPYVDYWYDVESDSLATDCASVRFNCETDKIDSYVVAQMLDELENLVTAYYKKIWHKINIL